MIKLNINSQDYEVDVDPNMPLLWVLRDELHLTGTKYGCGIAQCGACTVHINGQAMRSCSTPVGTVSGQVLTIEGLGTADKMHPLQEAWVDKQVAQCGYCQPGQIMQAADMLAKSPKPSQDNINASMSGNLCRCGSYPRIKEALQSI